MTNMHAKEHLLEGQSIFARKLAADPALRERCNAVVRALCEAVRPEIEAIERSGQLTAEDFAVTIIPCPIQNSGAAVAS